MSQKVGYGFHPNDEEIIYYLERKELGFDSEVDDVIAEVDILRYEPCQLPAFSVTNSNGPWYFYYKPEYISSKQVKRTTITGYWKATGQDRNRKVYNSDTGEEIGFKKILTYYKGRASNGKKTNWVIHEYHLKAAGFPNQWDYVVCCLKAKPDKKADDSTPDEGESSHQATFDSGNISENPSAEDNPLLLSNLESVFENGWPCDDSPYALQSQMVMELGQNLPFTDGFCNDLNWQQYLVDPSEQGNEDFINSFEETVHTHRSVSSRDSSVYPSTNMSYQINCIQIASEETPIHKSQYQPRLHKTVKEGVVPATIKLQGHFSPKAVIRGKVGEPAKHGTALDMLNKDNYNVESNKDMKRTQKINAKMSFKLSWNGPSSSDQKGFFIFQDTPQLGHSSNLPLVYLINTVLGIFLFIVVIQEVILFGDW